MCYLLANLASEGGKYYIGFSTVEIHRLRQHNRELTGGAKRTRKGKWVHVCIVRGFPSNSIACMFESAWQHYRGIQETHRMPPLVKKAVPQVRTKLSHLFGLLKRHQWTSRSPPAHEVPLVVEWIWGGEGQGFPEVPPYVVIQNSELEG